MKKILITALILCSFSTAFAQQKDLFDELGQKFAEILRETLKTDSAGIANFKKEKQELETQLAQQRDSIVLLKSANNEKDRQIAQIQQKAEQRFQDGKTEVVASIIKTYDKKSFDELLHSSTKESVQRDLPLIGNNPEIKQTLSYFSAKELLANKFDEAQIKKAQNQLNSINKESNLLDKLKENLENYKTYNDGLIKTITTISVIDTIVIAEGNDFVQKEKLNKILAEISLYVFNYDLNFEDYPHLSDIILEIMKRKQPNADANISDLKDKL